MRRFLLAVALIIPSLAFATGFMDDPTNMLYTDKVQSSACTTAPTKCWRYSDANAVKYAILDLRDWVLAMGSGATGGGYLITQLKGTTNEGYPTSTDMGVNRQGLDVILRDASGNTLGTSGNPASVSDSRLPAGLTAPSTVVTGSEPGLVVRNIPSGVQVVSGSGGAGSPAAGVVTVQGITSGTPVGVNVQNLTAITPGRAAASASMPEVLSTEDKAAIDLLHTDLAQLHTDATAPLPAGTNALGGVTVNNASTSPAYTAMVPFTTGMTRFRCSIDNVTATTQLTGCGAPGAGLYFYVTKITIANGSTAQSVQLVYGTGTNCGTGQTAATIQRWFNANAGTEALYPLQVAWQVPAANMALCAKPSSTGAFSVEVSGFVAATGY